MERCHLLLDAIFKNRSEEHTSELQSQSNLVCRLLLEKKTIAKRVQHGVRFLRVFLHLRDLDGKLAYWNIAERAAVQYSPDTPYLAFPLMPRLPRTAVL